MKVKLFRNANVVNLENEINSWISNKDIFIKDIKITSNNYGDNIVLVLYGDN